MDANTAGPIRANKTLPQEVKAGADARNIPVWKMNSPSIYGYIGGVGVYRGCRGI